MKKYIVVAFGMLFINSSCKKSYTCECKINGITTKYNSASVKFTKTEAESWCKSYAQGAGDCALK